MQLRKEKKIIKAIINLRNLDGITGNGDLMNIHTRLMKGRNSFQKVIEGTLDSAIQMSSLDLNLANKAEQVHKISSAVTSFISNINQNVSNTKAITSDAVESYTEQATFLQNISSNSQSIMEEIQKSEDNLNSTLGLTQASIRDSEIMRDDMHTLLEIITHMNSVIASINSISSQTNMLALNAAIEAARAGEAGKGFAVVAEEIRHLAGETRGLTENMSKFVKNIEEASTKSAQSVESTANSLLTIHTSMEAVVVVNTNNKQKIGDINIELKNIAQVSEVVSDSFQEVNVQIAQLDEKIEFLDSKILGLNEITAGLKEVINPIVNIEDKLTLVTQKMGDMSKDSFYMMDNALFVKNIKNAIAAHKKWVEALQKIVKSQVVMPLQTNEHKCGFGHFYYSVIPENPRVAEIWRSIEGKHKRLHRCGDTVIAAVKNENNREAEKVFSEAVELSKELIGTFENLVFIIGELDKQGKRVFENDK